MKWQIIPSHMKRKSVDLVTVQVYCAREAHEFLDHKGWCGTLILTQQEWADFSNNVLQPSVDVDVMKLEEEK